jgi:SpoVK/Ycf46/Vps4 family AAA+-type ATPase
MPAKDTLHDDVLTLSRLALTGRPEDVQAFIHKIARRQRSAAPELAEALLKLLRESPSRASPLRRETALPTPLDGESRLQLVRVEPPATLENAPILSSEVAGSIGQLVDERLKVADLHRAGLEPTRSALFVGPPGVGKTMTARWIAASLNLPLLILDLSAVMSSLLGRTGNNVRAVLDYARNSECVLLLDELDAVAKRRDDTGEIGELKRLVTVLLQGIDDWPSSRLLIAATNHPDLLDPAIWRRFDAVVNFPTPTGSQLRSAIQRFAERDASLTDEWLSILTVVFADQSFSDTERTIKAARRRAVLGGRKLIDELRTGSMSEIAALPRKERLHIAKALVEASDISQRQTAEITGVSRDTLRKLALLKPGVKHRRA